MTTALITGANRGIGLALTRALVERGVFVYATARQPKAAPPLVSLQEQQVERLRLVPLDVTQAGSVASCVEAVRAGADTLEILVNNAGVFIEDWETPLEALDVDSFDATFAVNVTGVARVTQAFLPLLLKAAKPRIANISSGAGSIQERHDFRFYCYGASKAALNHFTVGLANELGPRGVSVVAISPGWVRTDMGGSNGNVSPEECAGALADTLLRLTPQDGGRFLDRFGKPDRYTW